MLSQSTGTEPTGQTQVGWWRTSQNTARLSGLWFSLLTSVSLLESGASEFWTLCCVSQGLRGNSGLFPALPSSPPFLSVAEGQQGCELLTEVCLGFLSLQEEPLPFHPASPWLEWTKNRTLKSFLIPLLFLKNSCFPLQSTKILFALFIGGWERDGRDGWLSSLPTLLLM